MEQQTRVIL